MLVHSLCQKLCPDKLPVQPVESLGNGSDGEALTIQGQPDRVIKLSVMYEYPGHELKGYQQIQQVLDYAMTTQPSAYVRIYEHGYLGTYSRQIHVPPRGRAKQDLLLYYYIMEKLFKITEDEKKVFHSIISHEDRGIDKNYSDEKIGEMLQGMSRGLDFDAEKIILFCHRLHEAKIKHQDLHPRNIMKNIDGNYKSIDLDRCSLED